MWGCHEVSKLSILFMTFLLEFLRWNESINSTVTFKKQLQLVNAQWITALHIITYDNISPYVHLAFQIVDNSTNSDSLWAKYFTYQNLIIYSWYQSSYSISISQQNKNTGFDLDTYLFIHNLYFFPTLSNLIPKFAQLVVISDKYVW